MHRLSNIESDYYRWEDADLKEREKESDIEPHMLLRYLNVLSKCGRVHFIPVYNLEKGDRIPLSEKGD
jgi:hypothetical protein